MGRAGFFRRAVVAIALMIGLPFLGRNVFSADSTPDEKLFQWGGELKLIGSASWPRSGTVIQPEGGKAFFDGLAEGRLKGRFSITDWADLEVHYTAGIAGGDTRKAASQSVFPIFLGPGDVPGNPPSDKRQLLDMSSTPVEGNDFVFYHRLDRSVLTLQMDSAFLRLGRQAITWGNGLLFNPMDLINPLSPSNAIREYKVGQDMAFTQVSAGRYGNNLQLFWSPRRDPDTGRVTEDQSAFAGKIHVVAGETEFDIMAAKNFGDRILGAGGTGYLGDAVWRTDVIWTWSDGESRRWYVSAVANVDYSWHWLGKNWYGFVEVFHSGIGEKDCVKAINNPDLQRKIIQGQLFTLGKWYADGSIRVELHPLFNAYFTVIGNLGDPSWIVQPRVTWDFAKSFRLTVWGMICLGRKGSEYGGFRVPGTNVDHKPPNGTLAWLSYYF